MLLMTRHEIDCRRLLCPMPVIRVQDKVAELAFGDQLVAVCTDPGALHDIPAWCRVNGHKVIEKRSANGEHIVIVQVGSKAT